MSTKSLSASYYCDTSIYEQERKAIFSCNWLLIGHQQEIPQIGDQMARTIANIPLLIAHTPQGIRGYVNICVHRAGPLVWDGTKIHSNSIRCRYHGWRYNWEGTLTNAPDFGSDCPKGQLKHIHVSCKEGFIFVALEKPQQTLEQTFPTFWQNVTSLSLSKFQYSTAENHVVSCNWKTYVENYLEGYHVPFIHPSLQKEIEMRSYRVQVHNRSITHHVTTKENAVYDGFWGYAWPNVALNVYDGGFSIERITPISAIKTKIEYLYFFAPSLTPQVVEENLAMSRTVTQEDLQICTSVQQNLLSGQYQPGYLSPKHENGVLAFHRWIRMALGTDDATSDHLSSV